MKAISLHEPWATFVVKGWKTIETRTHPRFKNLVGKRILIHATLTPDNSSSVFYYLAPGCFDDFSFRMLMASNYEKTKGKIIGSVYVEKFEQLTEEHSSAALIDCGNTIRWGLMLKDPKQFDKPIEYSGKQFPFDVPDELIEE